MAQKKKTTAEKTASKEAPKKTTPQKRVYRVDISRTYSSFVYVKAESPEAAEQLAEKSSAADLREVDDRGDWAGYIEYECFGDEYNDIEPDIGGEDEPDESAEAEKKKAPAVDPAIVEGIVASMVPIPGKNFKMGKFPVTQAQWEAVMGENPSEFKGADRPVELVSWDDCQKFLKKLNASPAAKASGLVFRLPEEDEWEFACRAGATGKYCRLADGTEIPAETLGEVAWFEDNSGPETHPVGQKKPNAIGLYDMHGNVWEWTNTAFGELRVTRGGSCLGSAGYCGSSSRLRFLPSSRRDSLGFRLCASGRAASNDESAEEEKKKAPAVDPAVVEGIVASMVPIPGKDFKMCKFPVTQTQWEAVMGENPSEFKGADRPVEQVSWDDCQKFLKKLNASPAAQATGLVFRLPTASERDFAARAGAMGKYCRLANGTEITEETLGEVAWFEDNSGNETHPVGQKKPNAFGLYDMHGNVWEWTNTADAQGRITCGGCWYVSAGDCESSNRLHGYWPDDRIPFLGFRLCASVRAESNDGSASRK